MADTSSLNNSLRYAAELVVCPMNLPWIHQCQIMHWSIIYAHTHAWLLRHTVLEGNIHKKLRFVECLQLGLRRKIIRNNFSK